MKSYHHLISTQEEKASNSVASWRITKAVSDLWVTNLNEISSFYCVLNPTIRTAISISPAQATLPKRIVIFFSLLEVELLQQNQWIPPKTQRFLQVLFSLINYITKNNLKKQFSLMESRKLLICFNRTFRSISSSNNRAVKNFFVLS